MSTIETSVSDRSAAVAAPLSRLRTLDLAPHYSHEDRDLLDLFFVPALSCSTLYQRVSGYFCAEAMALAARGLNRLKERRGRVELIVGCILEPDEVENIELGYGFRRLRGQVPGGDHLLT